MWLRPCIQTTPWTGLLVIGVFLKEDKGQNISCRYISFWNHHHQRARSEKFPNLPIFYCVERVLQRAGDIICTHKAVRQKVHLWFLLVLKKPPTSPRNQPVVRLKSKYSTTMGIGHLNISLSVPRHYTDVRERRVPKCLLVIQWKIHSRTFLP